MRYFFKVELSGEGDTFEEAWEKAVESFSEDPGEPDAYTESEEEN
jgi:hypothetical protein